MTNFPTLDSIYHTIDLWLSEKGGISGTSIEVFEEELRRFCVEFGCLNESSQLVSFRLDGESRLGTFEEISEMLRDRAIHGKSYSARSISPKEFVFDLGRNTRERLDLYASSRVEDLLFISKPGAKNLSIQSPSDFDSVSYGTVIQVGSEIFFLMRMLGKRFWVSSTGNHYGTFEFFDYLAKKATLGELFYCLFTD